MCVEQKKSMFISKMLRLSKQLATEVIKPAVKEMGVTFARSSVPVTDYHQYYRRYFVLCRRVKGEQDRSVRRRFALYYLLLAYMALLNVAGYLLHHSVSPLVKVVLVDAIFVSGDNVHTYLAYNVMIAYTAVLQWQLFFRCSLPFNAILERGRFLAPPEGGWTFCFVVKEELPKKRKRRRRRKRTVSKAGASGHQCNADLHPSDALAYSQFPSPLLR